MSEAKEVKWIRYRFYTKSVDDYRPLIFNPSYPWWCSGQGDATATIIAWLPKDKDLLKYWDDAHDVDQTEHDDIEFTGRFDKPKYYVPLKTNQP